MKLQDVLTDYQYNNVGQFRAIAETLGYKEEYNKGSLRFTQGNDELYTSVNEIRAFIKEEPDISRTNTSMDRICQFFDREQALSPDYEAILSKENIDIVNWGDLKGDAKDRFTVIDHKNKVCYTGKEMYEYALENNYILDGKGTQLEKGTLSDLTNIGGKPSKVRLTEKGVSIFQRKEALIIPDKILEKKISKKQKQDLLEGNVIVLTTKKGDAFLHIDRDLNSVVIRSEKELAIPTQIGGYELTSADKYLLANGHSLDNKLLHSTEGKYIIADISMNPDKKGYAFANIQSISNLKAQEILQTKEKDINKEYLNDKLKDMQRSGKIDISDMDDKRYEQLINNHFSFEHKEFLSDLNDENPDKNYNYDLEGRIRIKSGDILEKEGVLSKGLTERELKEEGFNVELLREQSQEKSPVDNPVADRDFDNELKDAIAKNDYEKMYNLKEEGYRPSEEFIRGLGQDNNIDQTQAIVIEKVFGTKPDVQITEEITQSKEEIKTEIIELNDTSKSEKISTPDLDHEFKEAIKKEDFVKLSQLKEEGYQPSNELIQSLETGPVNTKIAVEKIFGIKGATNTLGDIKLAHSQHDAEKDIKRPLTNTLNKMFSDL